jgi:P27 family predicted phage terminase small subunit
MPAGRPPKPTALKKIEGNAGKRPLNDAEPAFPSLIALEPPGWLDPTGREHWLYHAPLLAASGVLTEADVSLLTAASERWSVYRRAANLMKKAIRGKNRFGEWVAPPQHAIASRALADYLTLMREFGVGPASRSRVKAEKQEEADEFEELLRRKA